MISRSIAALLMAASATVVVIAPAAPAQAQTCTYMAYCVTNYYSDYGKTTLVGSKTEYCGGYQSDWGTTSPFFTFTETFC